MGSDRFLKVAGDHLVDASGRHVTLRGYNIGGHLNMENFLTGFPSTESLQRGAMLRALGRERYELFFDRFIEPGELIAGTQDPRVKDAWRQARSGAFAPAVITGSWSSAG